MKKTAAEYYLSKARYSPSKGVTLKQMEEGLSQNKVPVVGFGSTAARFNATLLGKQTIDNKQ